jgi:hypothetical protein
MAFQDAGGAAKLVDAFNGLISTLLAYYGPGGTICIILGLVILVTGWRFFLDWLRNRKVNQALQEKEASIKRLAGEVRMYRALFLKEKAGWSDELIDKLILSDFDDGSKKLKSGKRRLLIGRRSKND